MFKGFLVSIFLMFILGFSNKEVNANVIRGFLQTNLVGLPVLHKEEIWTFDPDISLRRRRQFEELNGVKAEKLIERLGLGIDGFADERLQRQRLRDEGHLGGLNYFSP